MPTISLGRAETRSIPIAAAPGKVVAFLAEGRHLPDRAPNFATEVVPDGKGALHARRPQL